MLRQKNPKVNKLYFHRFTFYLLKNKCPHVYLHTYLESQDQTSLGFHSNIRRIKIHQIYQARGPGNRFTSAEIYSANIFRFQLYESFQIAIFHFSFFLVPKLQASKKNLVSLLIKKNELEFFKNTEKNCIRYKLYMNIYFQRSSNEVQFKRSKVIYISRGLYFSF